MEKQHSYKIRKIHGAFTKEQLLYDDYVVAHKQRLDNGDMIWIRGASTDFGGHHLGETTYINADDAFLIMWQAFSR